jgi:hypothetical protein
MKLRTSPSRKVSTIDCAAWNIWERQGSFPHSSPAGSSISVGRMVAPLRSIGQDTQVSPTEMSCQWRDVQRQ